MQENHSIWELRRLQVCGYINWYLLQNDSWVRLIYQLV